MNRRNALKNISIGMGLSISAGSLMTLVSSCRTEVEESPLKDWTGKYFTERDLIELLEKMTESILPATESPGAKQVGVLKYADMMVAEVYAPKEQDRFKKGMTEFIAKVEAEEDTPYAKLNVEQITGFLNKYIGATANKETYEAAMEMIESEDLPATEQQGMYYFYSFLNAMKSMTISGFFGDELIATEHLVYNPIPGPYEGVTEYKGGNDYYQ